MPNYTFQCNDCLTQVTISRSIKEPGPVTIKQEEQTHEEGCTATSMIRVWDVPAARTRQSASFLDGTCRSGWKDMKEAARLDVKKAGSSNEVERKEIQTEINRLRKA